MSLLLSILDDLDRESRSPVYDFGYGLHPHYIQSWSPTPRRQAGADSLVALIDELAERQRLARQLSRQAAAVGKSSGKSVASVGKDGFQVCMDVTQFKPSELNVKVVDNHIVVEGKHEEREDEHGYISRHFVRRYALPQGYEAEKVQSTLSSDGVLTVSVPKPAQIEDKSKERVIQIQQTGPAHLNIKSNAEEKKDAASGDSANGAPEK